MHKIVLSEALSSFSAHWQPHIVGEVNETAIKVVKFQGEFAWHRHEREDELFLVIAGRLIMRFRDHEVALGPGELIVVPHGVEHQPSAPEECQVLLVEPQTTLNTGDAIDSRTLHELPRITPYFLRSQRLGWRQWEARDAQLAQELWGDPRVAAFLYDRTPEPEAVQARLQAERATQAKHGVSYWPIFLLQGGLHVGCCGLRPHPAADYELGFHLRPEHWGQGLAREAAQTVIDHAFGTLGARSLFAGHHPRNERSQKLLQALGFQHTHDEPYQSTGAMHPSYRLER